MYCTLDDLVKRFGEDELLDLAHDETGQAVDQAVVDRAIEDATGEMDGFISAAGYPVPMDPVPLIVTAYCADIARYRLYDDRATEQVRKRYEDAVKFLRSVSRGDVKLGARVPAESSVGDVQFDAGRRVFGGGGF
jgi:phage gp36-like protein